MEHARMADEDAAHGQPVGPLHGLPIAHKDLQPTNGIRTTFGSPIYRDFVPAEDALVVERLRRAGAIVVGKTNTPEFGAGSQTFNPVFGLTLNPYDRSKTCGGSSGGAAVALATGMLPIADGTDMGASLRNPASFCNVVGTPVARRVPTWPAAAAWSTLSVDGPMARTVADVALCSAQSPGPTRARPSHLGSGKPVCGATGPRFQGRSRRVVARTLAARRWIAASESRCRAARRVRVARLHSRGGGGARLRRLSRRRLQDRARARVPDERRPARFSSAAAIRLKGTILGGDSLRRAADRDRETAWAETKRTPITACGSSWSVTTFSCCRVSAGATVLR